MIQGEGGSAGFLFARVRGEVLVSCLLYGDGLVFFVLEFIPLALTLNKLNAL